MTDSRHRMPDLQELQELQCFLTVQKGGLTAITYFVNVPVCKYNHVSI